jgi:hypothetical protein
MCGRAGGWEWSESEWSERKLEAELMEHTLTKPIIRGRDLWSAWEWSGSGGHLSSVCSACGSVCSACGGVCGACGSV